MASLGPRFLALGANCTKCFTSKSPLLAAALPSCSQVANLRSVNNPLPLPPREKPFTKKYNMFWQLFDSPIPRLNENSIVIIVEGNIGTGKKALAKKIAEEFDLLYVDDIDYNQLYKNYFNWEGFDMHEANLYAPDRLLFNDLETFWATKTLEDNPMIMRAQFDAFYQRWLKYRSALVHLMNTGQGIVMSRNMYSDMVFTYAMYRSKLFKKKVYQEYMEWQAKAYRSLWAPHLVVYLDATPAYCLKQIKDRKVPHEINSPILQDEKFLSHIVEGYDKKFLPKFETVSEVMVVEADNVEFDLLVEEMESIDFNPFRDTLLRDNKFQDWRLTHERQWAYFRIWCDASFTHIDGCHPPCQMPEIRGIQHTLEEYTTIWDYYVRKKIFYYDPECQIGQGGMKGAVKRFIWG